MTAPLPDLAASYELRIGAQLDQHWATWFDGFALTRHADGTTTLRGTVVDQAELHGLLAKVRDLGVPLISLRTIAGPRNSNISGHRQPCRQA